MSKGSIKQPILQSRMGSIVLWMGKFFYSHIEIVCVTCLNILKISIQIGTMKSATADAFILAHCHVINSLRLSDTYMHQ